MADIILVEYRGRTWLVRGERYIDDLLGNTLEPEISIEIVTCESESEVNGRWMQEEGDPDAGRTPWMIHPGIVARIKRPRNGHSIFFGQWSALLDSDAQAVIRAVATAADAAADVDVFLITYKRADEAQAMIDLTNLRCTLIEAELTGLGVAASRIIRESRDASADPNPAGGAQRLDVRVGPG